MLEPQLSIKAVQDVYQRSVIDRPKYTERGGLHNVILFVAEAADEMPPWSVNPRARDKSLREFWPKESFLASTVYGAAARASAFEWEIVASDPDKPEPVQTIKAVTDMLQNSDGGEGWESLMMKTLIDLYTTDNGSFWELVRAKDDPSSPVIHIFPLDSVRCLRTGDPQVPVIYTDRYGREHNLKWYQVRALSDMPSSQEDAHGVGYCAVTRVLRAAQILRSIAIYKYEKVSGQFARAIHFVGGVSNEEIQNALNWAKQEAANVGMLRYMQPVILPSIDPSSPISHEQIDLASLPDSFDEESTFRWYIAQLALGFGVDYQELAPLPGGNLGSSQQSQVLHMKTQGKGPALLMRRIEHIINNSRLIPRTVKFQFKNSDAQTETQKADAMFARAKARAMLLQSGEIDPQAARELAVLQGDIPKHIARQVTERGIAAPMFRGANQQTGPNQVMGGINSRTDLLQGMEDD